MRAPEAFSAMAILPYATTNPTPQPPTAATTRFAVGRGVRAVSKGKGLGPMALKQSMLFAKQKVRL